MFLSGTQYLCQTMLITPIICNMDSKIASGACKKVARGLGEDVGGSRFESQQGQEIGKKKRKKKKILLVKPKPDN